MTKGNGKHLRSSTKKSIDTEKDPYLLKEAPKDMAACNKCGAVYHNKRWSLPDKVTEAKPSVKVLCPACQKIKDGFAGGFVSIRGEFAREHAEEIVNLIRNKEERAMYHNPLDRIIDIKRKKGEMEVTTTTEKLAQRIGQVLHKSFSGKVEYKWGSDVKMARVVWTR
ncbi:MAG: BCAM0308 family protein [Thermodesulfobacteriota bacterium]